MKKILLALTFLLLPAVAGAVDLVAVFGGGITNCSFSATKVSLTANNTDSSTLTLMVNGMAYSGTVQVTETTQNKVVNGVTFPQTVTASAPGTWVLSITGPTVLVGRCAAITINSN